MSWHTNCYKKRKGDLFPVGKLHSDDLSDDELEDEEEMGRYVNARAGDHLMCPFQCNLCQFRNVTKRDPGTEMVRDHDILIAIRRAILDAFWSRATHTVQGNKSTLKRLFEIGSIKLGLEGFLPRMGPYPLEDDWGMKQAIAMLTRSLDKGRYKDYLQFDSVRKSRSAYSNCWAASVNSYKSTVIAQDTVKTYVTTCPTQGFWYEKFMKGMHSRMGDDHRPNAAISISVMHGIMNRINADYIDTEHADRRQYIARAGLFYMAAFLGSLRGEEVSRLVRKSFVTLNKESQRCTDKHVVLPLFGAFKGEGGVRRCFIIRVVNQTKSGLDMKLWVDRVILYESQSRTRYLFSNVAGRKERISQYEGYLFSKLEEIQKEEDGLIGKMVKIREVYRISRSFRRGSTTAAGNAPNHECSAEDIEQNNRWRREDNAGTKKASLSMIQLYTETLQSVKADLKFSSVL